MGAVRIVIFFLIAACLLWTITQTASWYGDEVLLDRMCDRRFQVLQDLRQVLELEQTGGQALAQKRNLMIASKLLYLVPQNINENREKYLSRVGQYLINHCKDG